MIAIGVGAAMIGLGGGLGWGLFPDLVGQMVDDSIDLTNTDSEGYENFVTPPVPVFMSFHIYHVLNPKEVVTNQEKPRFEEKGPYVYSEVREKINITIDKEAETLNYAQYREFRFEEDKSCEGCSKDDNVRILNMPLIGAVNKEKKGSLTWRMVVQKLAKVVDNTVDSEDLFLTDTVDNILFSGVMNNVVKLLTTDFLIKKELPPAIQFHNGFAIFNTKNETTHNECYSVSTSAERHSMINKWGPDLDDLRENLVGARTYASVEEGGEPDISKSKKWWDVANAEGEISTSHCNVLHGTNAEQFPRNLEARRDENLWIYTTDLCRSLYLNYLEDQDIDGIKVLRYSAKADGANVNKTRNVCFCKDLSDIINKKTEATSEECNPHSVEGTDEMDITGCEEDLPNCHDGLIDLSACMLSSVMMGSPHFYQAEAQLQYYDDNFTTPDASNDETYLDIEPITGMVLRAHKKIQVNMPVNPTFYDDPKMNNIKFLEHITRYPAFPVLWLDEGADIDQENIDKIKSMVTTPLLILDVVKYGLLSVGGIGLLLGASMFFMM